VQEQEEAIRACDQLLFAKAIRLSPPLLAERLEGVPPARMKALSIFISLSV
jgi:hypothetical protein